MPSAVAGQGQEEDVAEVGLNSLSCGWQAGRDNRPLSGIEPRRDLGPIFCCAFPSLFLPYAVGLTFLKYHAHSVSR